MVQAYDESWPFQFEELKFAYEQALMDVPIVSIEHVGSTSVPGLRAKPVIDIDIVVEDQHYQEAIAALVRHGYESRGELGISGRWAFRATNAPCRTNTYVVRKDSLALKNHLTVRNVLRRNPGLRDEYGAAKKGIAEETTDIDVYVSRKTGVLQRILRLGGLSEEELAEIAGANEI